MGKPTSTPHSLNLEGRAPLCAPPQHRLAVKFPIAACASRPEGFLLYRKLRFLYNKKTAAAFTATVPFQLPVMQLLYPHSVHSAAPPDHQTHSLNSAQRFQNFQDSAVPAHKMGPMRTAARKCLIADAWISLLLQYNSKYIYEVPAHLDNSSWHPPPTICTPHIYPY